MNTFQEIIKRNIKKNLDSGDYFLASKQKPPICKHCKHEKKATEVKRWGKQKPVIYEWRCDCVQEKAEQASMQIQEFTPVEDESKLNVVIIVYGKAMYITEEEKLDYIELIDKGKQIIIIRNYVLDKLYPMIPKEEYENQSYNKFD